MTDNRRRFRAFLGDLFTEAGDPLPESLRQLAEFIQQDRGREIVAWLQTHHADGVRDLRDFRNANRRIEAPSWLLMTWLGPGSGNGRSTSRT